MTGPTHPRPDGGDERQRLHPVMGAVLVVLGVTVLLLFGWALT